MTRTLASLILATLAATTFFASGAQACISCNYVPEVVNTPSPHDAKRAQRNRMVAQPQRVSPPAKQRIAKSEPAPKKLETARKTEPQKAIETADASPVETGSRAFSGTSVLENRAGHTEEIKVAQDVGCKKFFPTIGQTVTVPCE